MPSDADKNLIIEIDKKLTVLISKVETDIQISSEFKAEVKSEISKLQDRVRILELTDATNSNVMTGFIQVRNTLIKAFVGIAMATLMAAYAMLTTKGL